MKELSIWVKRNCKSSSFFYAIGNCVLLHKKHCVQRCAAIARKRINAITKSLASVRFYLQQKMLYPINRNATIKMKPKKSLDIIIINSIPIANQNNAKPMIRFILTPKKHILLLIYAFSIHSSLFFFFCVWNVSTLHPYWQNP